MDGTRNDEWVDNARMIVESARAVVPADGALDRVRKARFHGCGFDREVMQQSVEMGWTLMRLEEAAGGLGLGMRETCALMEVLGGGLVPEPVLSSMMAAALLQDAFPDEAKTGDALIVTAWQDETGAQRWQGGAENGRISGTKVNVQGAAGADIFAVVTGEGVAVVPRDAAGVTVHTQGLLDGGRLAQVTFEDVAADFLPCGNVEEILQDARLAQSAYLLGLSSRALEITLDYLRVRKQFGKPIGSFQSLQHRATEMKISEELSRAAIFATARRFDTAASVEERAQGAARCKRRAGDLAMLVAREAIQMHGAMGITDEADIGLYVRKAMTDANLFGSPRQQRATLSEMLKTEDTQ